MNAQQFLSLFSNVKKADKTGQYYADCPICDRQKHGRHASILFKENKILVNCWKCKTEGRRSADLIAPFGLQMSDLFTDEGGSNVIVPQATHMQPKQETTQKQAENHGNIIERREHIYKTPTGEIFGKKLIMKFADGHKACGWMRYDNGQYQKGLNGRQAPIYNADAVQQSSSVIIAEGEKDADTLCKMGYCGTTLAYGGNQSRWTEELAAAFRHKRIFIINDNDITGHKYIETLVNGLVISNTDLITVIPITRLWKDAPKKADITDYVNEIGLERAKTSLKMIIGE